MATHSNGLRREGDFYVDSEGRRFNARHARFRFTYPDGTQKIVTVEPDCSSHEAWRESWAEYDASVKGSISIEQGAFHV